MKHIYTLQDLSTYGVNLLTGEADRLSFRILCDLNVAGVNLVAEFLGIKVTGFSDNWNSTVNELPAIASVMLSAETLFELARFALMTVGNYDCVIAGVGMTGLNYSDKYADEHLKFAESHNLRIYRNHAKSSTAPGSGSRNEHMATGRIE